MTHHLHIYERLRGKGGTKTRYKCMDPDCSHTNFADIIIGKRVRCSICKEAELIVKPDDIRRKHFRCIECSQTAAAQKIRSRKEYVSSLLSGLQFGELE